MDYESLTDTASNGYVKTKCPSFGNFEKKCTGNVWVWSFSGVKLSYSDWNSATGEPNGGSEHCVTLWLKGDYR